MKRLLALSTIGFLLLVLNTIGCGDGSDDGPPPALLNGVFLDSVVQGLNYQTPTQQGITDQNGTFRYLRGEVITFSIGQIILGSAPAKSQMTPLDLVANADGVTDQEVTNICRLLQTLDDDNDLSNGIQITEGVRDAATCSVAFTLSDTAFEDDACVITLIGSEPMVTADDAQAHLSITIACDDMQCNHGQCVDGSCVCDPGYTGDSCETNIDDCNPNPCQNGGTCTDGVDSYSCDCAEGYSGENCEFDDPGNDSALIGTWNAVSVNGQPFAPGVWLTWTFTQTTLTITTDLDCIEVVTYSASPNEITGTIISLEGSQCGDELGDLGSFPYELSGNRLTITYTDPELGVGVFVFTRG
jgi:hypothetical protein